MEIIDNLKAEQISTRFPPPWWVDECLAHRKYESTLIDLAEVHLNRLESMERWLPCFNVRPVYLA